MSVTISATVQNVYPPRVAVAVTGLTLGDDLAVYRETGGTRTAVRGGTAGDVTDTGFAVIDAELPFGEPVRYIAVVNGGTEYATSATAYTLTGGKVALSDAVTGLSAEVTILAAAAKTTTRDSARVRAGGRNLIVTGPAGLPEGTYDLYVETDTAFAQLDQLLRGATGATIQIRQPGGYSGVDAYLGVDRYDADRWSQDGSDERRIVTLSYAEVDPWPVTLTAREFTYGEVEDFYSGLTYADAAGDYATYLDAVQGDFS